MVPVDANGGGLNPRSGKSGLEQVGFQKRGGLDPAVQDGFLVFFRPTLTDRSCGQMHHDVNPFEGFVGEFA